MASDGQIVAAAARWSDESVPFKDFSESHQLPSVVKIVKGQYGGLGIPSLSNPGLQSIVLLYSAGKGRKILGQTVKIKEGRRVIGVGPRIEIPEFYPGYFELLSEDGRTIRSIESVLELARRRTENGCFVREPIRTLVGKREEDGTLTTNGSRLILAGEILYPKGEVQVPGHKTGHKFLHCVDCHGHDLLLGIDQRGKFSVLAKEDNISGVHSTKNLFSKRLPLTVRLVHGPAPKGPKRTSRFVPELRLLSVTQDESIYAMPLQKDTGNVVMLPTGISLRVQPAKNSDVLRGMKEFQRLSDKCESLVREASIHPQVLSSKQNARESRSLDATTYFNHSNNSGSFLRRSASLDSPPVSHPNENRVPTSGGSRDEYDEIDQIYDYVRGFAPLPKNIRSPFADPHSLSIESTSHRNDKPEPPPIETIPSKKIEFGNKAEKRTRKEASTESHGKNAHSLYVKNASSPRGRILRHKSVSPMKEPPGKTGSPVFSVRYKSWSNLQQAMEMDGTLDSSHSGGKTSGDSLACAKLPEKRSRRLSRPLSLTNLVWEICREPCRTQQIPLARRTSKPSPQPIHIGTLYL